MAACSAFLIFQLSHLISDFWFLLIRPIRICTISLLCLILVRIENGVQSFFLSSLFHLFYVYFIFKNFTPFHVVWMFCLYTSLCTMCGSAQGGQRGHWIPWNWSYSGCKHLVWVLGIERQSSAVAVYVLTHGSAFPAPCYFCGETCWQCPGCA